MDINSFSFNLFESFRACLDSDELLAVEEEYAMRKSLNCFLFSLTFSLKSK